jgi:hypothetical protein
VPALSALNCLALSSDSAGTVLPQAAPCSCRACLLGVPADGPEAPDFLNIDFLLAPSPPPPPVEDSSGSGTMGGPPLASVPMATGPAAPAHLGHEQQQHHQHQQHMLSPMEQAALHAHFGHGHGQADGQHYMLSMGSAPGSGTLPTFDPNAGMPIMPQPHSTPMLHMATQLMAQPAGAFSQPGPHPGSALVLPALTAVPADSSQQGAPSEAGNGEGNGNGKRRRGPRPRVFKKHTCQSDGCTVDLAPLSFYLQRNHICTVCHPPEAAQTPVHASSCSATHAPIILLRQHASSMLFPIVLTACALLLCLPLPCHACVLRTVRRTT